MKHMANIARSGTPGDGVQVRKLPYGPKGIESFLRDVLALANASLNGPRYIIIGTEIDSRGRKRIHPVNEKDFSGKPAYEALANEYIEPALRIRYQPVTVNGKTVGVFEIADCKDRPYMMRIDYSESLRRGDAYMRLHDSAIKMGRRQLQSLFERKFHDSIPVPNVEVGFGGDIIHKSLTLNSCDLLQLPSAMAASKLEQLVKIQMNTRETGSTTVMARLVHARLYGSDDPYVRRTPDQLMREMEQIRHKYRDHDHHFLFETNCERIQIVVCNQGEEPIIDASIALVLPKDNDLYIAERIPKALHNKKFVDRSPAELASYPSIRQRKKSIHITSKIGDIPVEKPTDVFASPLRICIGPGLVGRRFGIRYALHGQNLRSPATGTLRLNFRNPPD